MDYLETRFKGPVYIAESSAGDTMQGFENFKYSAVTKEYKSLKISLLDFNRDAAYVVLPIMDYDLHVVPVRLAKKLMDPDAFIQTDVYGTYVLLEDVISRYVAQLFPGMPVEAFVQTGDRTMLSYLMKPLHDQLMRAFRER